MTCIICLDEMDMEDFNDKRETTPTCFKLECGHAFHTKCIIQTLSQSDHKCPSCNLHKAPVQRMYHEGIIKNLISSVKKDVRVRIVKKELDETIREYKMKLKQLRSEATEWIKKRAKELGVISYIDHYKNCLSTLLNTAKTVATEMGPRYIAAIRVGDDSMNRRYRSNTITRKILLGSYLTSWRIRKLKNPRVSTRIK
jgi:hypothetical protein